MSKTSAVHSTKSWGAKNCLFYDGSHLDKTMPDDITQGRNFYPPFVNARHDYGASGKRSKVAPHSECKCLKNFEMLEMQFCFDWTEGETVPPILLLIVVCYLHVINR